MEKHGAIGSQENQPPERGEAWVAALSLSRELLARESWTDGRDLGELANFWLWKHASLNSLGTQVRKLGVAWREGQLDSQQFRSIFPSGISQLLNDLQGHHQVEDQHYFPLFRRAEPRLAKGFDVLETDHVLVHAQIVAVAEAANDFLRISDTDAMKISGERYIDATEALIGGLSRHLSDEEDLVIPLIATHLR